MTVRKIIVTDRYAASFADGNIILHLGAIFCFLSESLLATR